MKEVKVKISFKKMKLIINEKLNKLKLFFFYLKSKLKI